MTELRGAVVLITGANGGLGQEFVAQALAGGATKVYAAARTPREWDDSRVVPLTLDVTDRGSIARAAELAHDVTILVNNAGATSSAALSDDDLSGARALFDVNFWGQLETTNAFAGTLRSAHGAIVNVLSVLSWLALDSNYSATKAAFWSATNSQRVAFADADVQVLGLHLGYTDTPMTAGVDAPKNDPADVVAAAYAGLIAGAHEVLADEVSRQVKAGLAGPIEGLYPQLAS